MKGRGKFGKIQDVPGQKKITQFFRKDSTSSTSSQASANSATSTSSTPTTSSSRQKILKPNLFRRPADRPKQTPSAVPVSNGSNSQLSVSSDDDILEVIEVPIPPPSPKELVVISSSSETEDDHDADPEADSKGSVPGIPVQDNGDTPAPDKNGDPTAVSTPRPSSQQQLSSSSSSNSSQCSPSLRDSNVDEGVRSDDSSTDEILSQVDIEECIRSSQELEKKKDPDRSGTFEDDDQSSSSGDDILSHIDVDEVIRSSQSSLSSTSYSPLKNDEGEVILDQDITSTPPPKSAPPSTSKSKSGSMKKLTNLINNLSPPKKTAHSKVTKFSPVRHLPLKRTSSEASLGSPPKSYHNYNEASSSNRSPKRNLNFDSVQHQRNPSPTKVLGGGRYYLRNFMSILTEVVSDKFHAHLISSEDHKFVQSFTSLSLDAQSLYVRLFQRKWGWKTISKLNGSYKELPPDLLNLCKELGSLGFFEEISVKTATLEEILDTLDLSKLISLSKKMMLNPSKKTKDCCKDALLSKVKNQKTLNGTCGSNAVIKQALSELGPTYRVSAESKTLFSRLFILYSPPQYWEIESDQASNQLLVILLNAMGQMEYASYKIMKETVIYRTREDLLKFHEAFQIHSNLVSWAESKDWGKVIELTLEASRRFEENLQSEDVMAHDLSLPKYLRIYTAGSVLTHVCWMGVDGFQKAKKFKEANDLIRKILKQDIYLQNHRGRCWERLAINEGHLKKGKEDIKKLLEEGLEDPYLQRNHKLILSQRLGKLQDPKKKAPKAKEKEKPKDKKKEAAASRPRSQRLRNRQAPRRVYIDDSDDEVDSAHHVETPIITFEEEVDEAEVAPDILTLKHEVPTRTITGEKMDRGPGNMGKAIFLSKNADSQALQMSSVEQHTISFYLSSPDFTFTSGLHGEGSTVVTLYGLLFWDVIFYDNLPDAFHTRYQGFPLDLHFPDFFTRRKPLILEKLDLIRNILSMEDLHHLVEQVWEENYKKLSIVNWQLFDDLKVLKGLMTSMGQKMIGDICERLSMNYRYYHSGFPDLVVWDESTQGKVLFVEVKGPGDSLSPKQQLWLDWMLEKGIPCEVCHVKSVSNKRIRLSS